MEGNLNRDIKQLKAMIEELDIYIHSEGLFYKENIEEFTRRFNEINTLMMLINERMQNPIDEIQCKNPFKDAAFIQKWIDWKEYLLVLRLDRYSYQEEKEAIAFLYEMTGGNSETAIKILKHTITLGELTFMTLWDLTEFFISKKTKNKNI
ncbi:hypothetical protein EZS27_031009 [termite gut metagenome]|uniref:Uncharacterized protein n=1 Tax=termite gut metagenome TaxID=433724 RepID=A0A5J4QC05_9ZZZZ